MASLGTWEHGPLAQWCPDQDREIQQMETIMYQNKVTLIGFLGSNAEVRTSNSRSFTTLSLATKSSYKKDDKYISHTEWHRCVVFGKLSEFAKTLSPRAHISRSKANCAAGSTRARRRTRSCASGKFGSLR